MIIWCQGVDNVEVDGNVFGIGWIGYIYKDIVWVYVGVEEVVLEYLCEEDFYFFFS